jgi:hypothetical protein
LKPPTEHSAIMSTLVRDNPFIHSSVVYRAAAVQRLGGYRAAFEAAEDYDLWLRISEVGKVANLPKPLMRYRFHKESVSWHNELRQTFSVRLAKRAAQLRRSEGQDPAEALIGPPDWWAIKSQTAFFAEDSRIFQFLELSDAAVASTADLDRIDLQAFAGQVPLLTHRERKIGQHAVVNLLGRAGRPPTLSSIKLVSLFVRLHPARALVLGWNLLPDRGAD